MGSCSSTDASSRYAAPDDVGSAQVEAGAASQFPQAAPLHAGPILCVSHWGEDAVVSGGDDGVVMQWHSQSKDSPPAQLAVASKPICSVASTDAGVVMYGTRDGQVHLAGVDSAPSLHSHTLSATAVGFAAGGQLALSGSRDGTVAVHDVQSGARTAEMSAPRNLVTCAEWLPAGSCSASGADVIVQGAEDLKVRVWDVRAAVPAPALELEGYVYFPLDLACAADGVRVLTCSKGFNGLGGEARLWDLRAPEAPVTGDGAAEQAPASTPLAASQQWSEPCHEGDAAACTWLLPAACASAGHASQDLFATAGKDGVLAVRDAENPSSVLATFTRKGPGGWMGLHANEQGLVAGHFDGSAVCLRFDGGDSLSVLAESAAASE